MKSLVVVLVERWGRLTGRGIGGIVGVRGGDDGGVGGCSG